MTALLLAATLMQPGDFTGAWSFQSRIVSRVSVVWGDLLPSGERVGRTKQATVIAFQSTDRLAIGVFEDQRCLLFLPTRASRDHRHLRGRVYVADRTCQTALVWGPFRAHRRRP